MNNITVINNYNWDLAALYVNGARVSETHSFRIRDLADYVPIESIEELNSDDLPELLEWWEINGDDEFPEFYPIRSPN